MQEIWKDVKNFEGIYQVSNLGNIRRVATIIPFKGTPSIRKGRLLKPTKNTKGYFTIVLCWKGYRRTVNLHRLIAECFIDNPDNKPQVNHIDGDKLNNHIDNLEWCTPGENQKHAYSTGLKNRNEKFFRSKLTNNDVIKIKRILLLPREVSNNKIYIQLANQFGVSKTSIKWIDQGKTGANIQVHTAEE
jgi:hypothetical protein